MKLFLVVLFVMMLFVMMLCIAGCGGGDPEHEHICNGPTRPECRGL